MSIPLTGVFAILLAAISLLKREWLLRLLIISSPFSATAVINFPDAHKSLTFPIFFSIVYIVVSLTRANLLIGMFRDVRFWFAGAFVLSILLGFVLTPEWSNSNGAFINPPKFTQLIYVFLGVLTALFVAQDIKVSQMAGLVTRSIHYAVVLICLIGIFQLLCYLLNLDYPSWIFNNSINPSDQGYTAVLAEDFKRISAASSEPSILALFLVSMFFVIVDAKMYISNTRRWLALFLVIIVLLLSTSATAYLAIALFLFLLPLLYFRKIIDRLLFLFIVFLLSLVVIYMAMPLIELKLGSYSGVERLGSVMAGWSSFVHYPLLGHGWGTVTVNSLPVGILANAGLVGFVFFLSWVLFVLYESFITIPVRGTQVPIKGYLFAFIMLLVLQSATGFAYVYSFFWIMFGALMGLSSSTKPLFQKYKSDVQSV